MWVSLCYLLFLVHSDSFGCMCLLLFYSVLVIVFEKSFVGIMWIQDEGILLPGKFWICSCQCLSVSRPPRWCKSRCKMWWGLVYYHPTLKRVAGVPGYCEEGLLFNSSISIYIQFEFLFLFAQETHPFRRKWKFTFLCWVNSLRMKSGFCAHLTSWVLWPVIPYYLVSSL